MLTIQTTSADILFLLIGICAVSLTAAIALTFYLFHNKKAQFGLFAHLLLTVLYTAAIICLFTSVFYGVHMATAQPIDPTIPPETTSPSLPTQDTTPTEPIITVPPETEPPATDPVETAPTLGTVSKTKDSDPVNWNVDWDIFLDGQCVDSVTREESVFFSDPLQTTYFALPGIATFRGDPYRSGAAFGTADLSANTLTPVWNQTISALAKGTGTGSWSGCGWTGQPLIVQWDPQTRQIMNLYEDKKSKDGLTEVIYATLDGNIYFYDLDDGTYTRDSMYVGMAFKGAGALDPRGYPLMYVGSGDKTADGKAPRMFIISLIDCTILYEYGNSDPAAKRSWCAFDSSPLVDAATDTLIWPGENGVLYTMCLNTAYDKAAGSIQVSPDTIVKTRYQTSLGRTLGYESSAVIVEHYLYIADNGGMLFCIDLNTMQLAWAQNLKDDCNATPIFEWGDDGKGYLYCATSMEYRDGTVSLYKLDAASGEILWEKEYDGIYYDKLVSGGVLSTPVLGKKGTSLEGMIFFSIAKTPTSGSGLLVALDTATGDTVWEKSLTYYCWSSPSLVYSESGEAAMLLCDANGNVMMIDPITSDTLSSVNIGANIEASPAIFNNILVVGTRGMKVYAIQIS